jgi:hypothetical protein
VLGADIHAPIPQQAVGAAVAEQQAAVRPHDQHRLRQGGQHLVGGSRGREARCNAMAGRVSLKGGQHEDLPEW